MTDSFEDHCWKDVVSDDVLQIYAHYRRPIFVGPSPAMLVIDLYELAYQGGPIPVAEVTAEFPSSCGIHAWDAILPTQRVLAAARAAGLPVFYTTGEMRPASRPRTIKATKRQGAVPGAAEFAIRPEFGPHEGDVIITKQRASAFFGTPLSAHLTQLGIQSLIVVGESTSGCVRASTVDGYSHGYHMTVVEECCFDRSVLSHKVNLFDLHHKYADVMTADAVSEQLDQLARQAAAA